MWNNQSQRPKVKKREKERIRLPIHIKRITALLDLLSPEPTEIVQMEVRVVLNDFSTKGMQLFSSEPLIPGQSVSLTIQDPVYISVRAKVRWCQEYNPGGHVLSVQPYSYRLGIEFIPSSPEEQQAIKNFYDEITRKYLYTSKSY
jgi:hypothetical protein